MEMKVDLEKTRNIIEKYRDKKGVLIPMLQDVQAEYGYVPKESIELIADQLNISPLEIHGVLTFYTQFYLTPRGKHTIRVCQGTACHVMGGKQILDHLSSKLQIADGETTGDGQVSLERVACLGTCGMAPVVAVDDDFYGWVTVQKMDEILDKYGLGEAK
jgi:NADH-quinone oxidoreductase subunit E